ncbi:hypothetical protein DTO013E5_9402 [Penicillium roqueforti]|uniref:Pal1 cell morphology n=1 Tax=Penicillium roqueforti (strain FM164) TaxID=1365484 RepID=W6QA59_PENRF|nr:uncharacterized protein LCP9604111_9553 [Penicillium roqueforti]CDM32891.1 Pal1 cell morphology [Penicillium roqueforti FM164]KAF9238141.1 hypothetical protein LCP9604111_9553 [Penicillium roqueforti]KAI1830144.1 hypothetical protein CBS147337_9062 [Penicillium roqueforti]KAI2672385.1 hypothetical protein CBS147355_8105 [Penicillium roqueforti]KAI2675681.1 hypothetical protein LCP963914a_8518 [Penicillium roqueforti]
MAVDCIPMASSHHFNQLNQDRPNVRASMGSNNPYARFMSPAPSGYSQRSRSESLNSTPSIWYSGAPEHYPVEPRRKRESSAPHRRRTTKSNRHSMIVQPDIIDRLDNVSNFSYHHEGPYDATRPERNRFSQSSPLEAVKESNAEALRATPHHKIADALNSHRPLDGVAFYPPGTMDRNGQEYSYEEGSNMMNDFSGNFMRLPGTKFTDEDFKNDPFYNRPLVNPFSELRKKISLRLKKRRNTH